MKLLTKIGAYFNRINESLAVFSAVIIVYMCLSITLDITIRSFLGTGFLWAVEVCEYCLLIMTFAAAAWVLQVEGHVSMDFVVRRLKPRGQALLNFVTSILGAAVCLAITWLSAEATWVTFKEGIVFYKMLAVPRAPIMLIIPIGSFLLFVQFLRRAYRYLGHWKSRY